MLESIYASATPDRFEQLDVSDLVAEHFPVGTGRAVVKEAFLASASSKRRRKNWWSGTTRVRRCSIRMHVRS